MSAPNSPSRQAFLWAALLTQMAGAQELSLDLTDSTDYRPTAALVGIGAGDDQAPPELGAKLKVDQVAASAVAAAEKLGLYAKVLSPAEAFGRLSEEYGEAFRCAEAGCMAKLAARLNVNQVLVGQLVREEGRTLMRLRSYTRFTDALDSLEVPAERPRDFERGTVSAVESALKKAAAVLGIVKVQSPTPGASARLGAHPLGPLPVSTSVPPGSYALTVEAPGHLPDEVELEIAVGQTREVESNLVPRPAEAPPVAVGPVPVLPRSLPPAEGGSLFRRPGWYVALAGVAALTAGAFLGSQAKAIEARAQDGNGDGALDITRREANLARRNASLANAFFGLGSAAVAGGTAWILLTPTAPTFQEPDTAPVAMMGMLGFSGVLP